jgi:5'-nucleotidase / UDP-sugar diphosphatase
MNLYSRKIAHPIKIILMFFLGGLICLLSACQSSQTSSLTLIFTNDIHGVYKPYQIDYFGKSRLVGGMEALSYHIKNIRAKDKNVILIDSGDIMTGTLASQKMHKGVYGGAMIEFLNLLGYDLRCPGNHGFDLGIENVISCFKLTEFPIIMANLIYKDTQELIAPSAYHIIDKGSLRVGFIAVMEENFFEEVKRENTRNIELLPIIPTLNKYISKVEPLTDIIVVLSHDRFYTGEKIAREVPGVNVVLVAAENGKFNNINGVLVKSTYGHLRTFGYINLKFSQGTIRSYHEGLKWLWADGKINPDPEVTKLVRDVDSVISEEYGQKFGRALKDIVNKSDNTENPIGNWITDVLRWKTGAQIGLYNSRGIRNSLRSGWITGEDIFEVAPFFNELVMFCITGEQLKSAFEKDIERGRDRLQVSGLRYEYYPKKTRPYGKRVWLLEVNGEKVVFQGKLIHPDKIFTAVSNDYVVSQAESKYIGYSLEDIERTGLTLNEVLISWLKEFHALDYSTENRIVKKE